MINTSNQLPKTHQRSSTIKYLTKSRRNFDQFSSKSTKSVNRDVSMQYKYLFHAHYATSTRKTTSASYYFKMSMSLRNYDPFFLLSQNPSMDA